MKLIKQESKNAHVMYAFFIPFITFLVCMIITRHIPGGPNCFFLHDAYHQYFPFAKLFREQVLNGGGFSINWDIGMGMDYMSTFSYYLASPLMWLGVWLPETAFDAYVNLLMPLRLALASTFFAYFLGKIYNRKDFGVALFGGFYGTCAWALGYMWNMIWLDTFMLTPLVILGTIELIRNKKYILYTIALALAMICNYYIGFFVCVFVFFVFCGYQIIHWPGFKKLCKDTLRIGIFTTIAMGMAAVILLPTIVGLGKTFAADSSMPTYLALNLADSAKVAEVRDAWEAWNAATAEGNFSFIEMLKLSGQSFLLYLDGMRVAVGSLSGSLAPEVIEGYPNVYCGVFTVVFAVLFMLAKHISKREKIVYGGWLLFLFSSFVIRQLDYIWHGFHFPNMIPFRFSFILSFTLLMFAYKAYALRKTFNLYEITVAGLMGAFVLLLNLDAARASTDKDFFFEGIFLAAYIIILCLPYIKIPKRKVKETADNELSEFGDARTDNEIEYDKRLKKRKLASKLLVIVMCVELCCNIINADMNYGAVSLDNHISQNTDISAAFDYMESIDDELFYRSSLANYSTLNDSAMFGKNGIGTFNSMVDVDVTNFLNTLGYEAQDNYNQYRWYNSSPVNNMFLNIKYMVDHDEYKVTQFDWKAIYSSNNATLYQNNYYLPVGFMVNPDIQNLSSFGGNPFFVQNKMLQLATDVNEDVWEVMPEDSVTLSSPTGTYKKTGLHQYKFSTSENGKMYFDWVVTRDGYYMLDVDYIYPKNWVTVSIAINGQYIDSSRVSLSGMRAVGDVKAGDTVRVLIHTKQDVNYTMALRIGVLNEDVFETAYNELADETLTLTEFTNNSMRGSINVKEDGMLYMSVPYDEYWTMYVDGVETEITPLCNAMIMVPLTAGEHDIQIVYTNQATQLGLIISSCSLGLFIAIIIIDNRKKIVKNVKSVFKRCKKA